MYVYMMDTRGFLVSIYLPMLNELIPCLESHFYVFFFFLLLLLLLLLLGGKVHLALGPTTALWIRGERQRGDILGDWM